ncbi:filamentous hemagglutinin N-terminal domain-containing protein [Candidatus Halobeggiatoa sp. HSG11]|nr:filamentous hemagglutinin N-terminal domain-containing protein [Candidatus Halobeggiatoa sp. HSG11]
MKYLPIILLITTLSINAEIITDGTLGQNINLPGPDFQIGADLGQQHGGNLFHSFQDFNLNSLESATFSGPNNVQNILSRVTGGNPSNIDGLIRSTIPDADMYFLNPNGIIFGPNAKLDVQGSFHASTADYLRLGNGGRFAAQNLNNSLLTIAPVEAFGFLDNDVADISVEGHGEILSTVIEAITSIEMDNKIKELEEPYQEKYGLTVPEGKTLSLIGGNLTIKDFPFLNITKRFFNKDGGFDGEYEYSHNLGIMYAPNGRINLASVASKGEVKLGDDFVDVSSFTKMADINIKEKTQIDTSGEGGGIFIRSGQFVVNDSEITADTKGQQNGYGIDIEANDIFLTESNIFSNTEGKGNVGQLLIVAQNNINVEGGGYK